MSAISDKTPSQFRDHVAEALSRTSYRRIDSDDALQDIAELRYRAYLAEGAVSPNADERLEDRYDHAENCFSFGVYLGDHLASALRLHVVSRQDGSSPACDVFPDILQPIVDRGATIIDPNRFVADYDIARTCPALPYLTLRLAFMAAEHFDADVATATVRTEHQAFYKRTLNYEPVAAARDYPTLIKPLTLMIAEVAAHRLDVLERYPFFASEPMERQELFAADGFFVRPHRADHVRPLYG